MSEDRRDPILVGESNPHGPDPQFALYCEPPESAGGRLQRLVLALRPERYLELPRANLCGRRWTVLEARAEAKGLLRRAAEERRHLVLLGAKVADAFDLPHRPFSATALRLGGEYLTLGARLDFAADCLLGIMLPHPSGRCRAWNEPGACARARQAVLAACPHLPLGELEDAR